MPDNENSLIRIKERAKSHLHKQELTEAASLLEGLATQNTADVETWGILAFIYNQRGDTGRLIEAFRQLSILLPRNFNAYFNLALALHKNGKLDEAIACYRNAMEIDSHNADVKYNLALAMQENGAPDKAAPYYREALRIQPNWPEALNNLSLALRASGDLDGAINLLEKAVASNPSTIKLRYSLAETYDEDCQFTKSLQTYQNTLELEPDNAVTLSRIGSILLNLGRIDAALDHYQRALHLDPGNTDFRLGLIDIYESTGNYADACYHLLPLIENKPVPLKIALKFASLCRHLDRCAEAIDILTTHLEDAGLPQEYRRQLHFALGKLFDSAKDYDRAFRHVQQANALVNYKYDDLRFSLLIQSLTKAFSAGRMSVLPRGTARPSSPQPVFIVGMPRSGTSLVEHIIATHSSVFGAGELDTIPRMVAGLASKLGSKLPYPQCISLLRKEILDQLNEHYREITGKLSDKIPRVITDKMPENFLHLGLIEMIFPDAKIIHCTRDALDTCLSCYFQEFRGTHHYAYSLTDLGAYYLQYQRVMEHWNQTLTIPVFQVRYEEMVRSTEAVSRALVDFLGLDWEEQCLQFYNSGRFVNTASQHQVNRPIYTDSAGRWRNYATYLEPLKSVLGIVG